MNKDLDEAVAEATVIHYCDDPLHLAVPYMFFMEKLPEPPDGLTKSTLSLALILFVYLYPVFKALIQYYIKGAHAHLHQNMNKDLDEAVAEATVIHYYNDPLHLAVPYMFFMEILPEPPDGLTKSTLSLAYTIRFTHHSTNSNDSILIELHPTVHFSKTGVVLVKIILLNLKSKRES